MGALIRFINRVRRVKSVALLEGTVNEFFSDNCPHLAAAISYYLLFSLFPLGLAAISIAGFILRSPDLEARAVASIFDGIGQFLPVSSEFITGTIQGAVKARGTMGALATIGLLWAGTAVFNAIRKSLNTAWGVRQMRPFFKERLVELCMMAGVALFFVLSLASTAAVKVLRELSLEIGGAQVFNGDLLWHSIAAISPIVLTFAAFLFLYKFIPNARIRWRDVWVGALLATIAFEVAKNTFVWLVGNFSHYNLIYGSVGTVIALLLWTYISAFILLFCAKITSVYARVISRKVVEIATPESLPEKARGGAPSQILIPGSAFPQSDKAIGEPLRHPQSRS